MARAEQAWPGVCDRFALRVLVLCEQLRPALDHLEKDEEDPDRLRRLYEVDHAVTRMRRAARDMRVLAERDEEELTDRVSSLRDVARMAESSIEYYSRVHTTTLAELAIMGYAAEDVASILAVLLENATTYSPSTVTLSAHPLEDGGVMFRVEDTGIGIAPAQLEALNAMLSGEVPAIDRSTGTHTGLPVAHRLARKHGIRVRLSCRSGSCAGGAGGTVATVALPPHLICEPPEHTPLPGPHLPAAEPAQPQRTSPARSRSPHLTVAPGPPPRSADPEAEPTPPARTENRAARSGDAAPLPRRERKSLRGTGAGPAPGEPRENDFAAAGHSFAEDLNAFASGSRPDHPTGESSSAADRSEDEVS